VGNGNAEVEKSFKESEPVVIAVADADLSKQFEAKPVVDLHVPTTESASRSAMEQKAECANVDTAENEDMEEAYILSAFRDRDENQVPGAHWKEVVAEASTAAKAVLAGFGGAAGGGAPSGDGEERLPSVESLRATLQALRAQDRLSGTLPTEPVAIRFEPITAPHVQSQPESSWSDAGEAELVHAIKHAAAENAA